MGRPSTRLLVLGLVVAIVAGAVAPRLFGATPTPQAELATRLIQSAGSTRFSFAYTRGGTRVLDCFMVNLQYGGRVDARARRLVLHLGNSPGAQTIAVVEPQRVLLRRTLFEDPPFASAWLAVPRPVEPTTNAALRRSLGADLGAEVTATELPASGRDLVQAALAAGRSVEALDATVIDGRRADGFRIRVDPEKYRVAATVPSQRAETTAPAATGEVLPRFDVWLDGADDVVRVTVQQEQTDGKVAPAEQSWTIDYSRRNDVAPPVVIDADITAASRIDVARLRPARPDCRIPG